MKNKIKPTEKQKRTLMHLQKAKSLQEAMLKGGYSLASSTHPKQNFIEREGVKSLIEEYRDHLVNAGISPEILAEIQAEGLFDPNGAIRLGYLKETKKDFGLVETVNNIQINNIIGLKKNEYSI